MKDKERIDYEKTNPKFKAFMDMLILGVGWTHIDKDGVVSYVKPEEWMANSTKDLPEELRMELKNDEVLETLTQDQEIDICYVIGDWYTIWKRSLFNGDKDYIEVAVFMLKNMINYAKDIYPNTKCDLSEEQKEVVFYVIDLWAALKLVRSSNGGKTHNFGHAKEILKSMICGE